MKEGYGEFIKKHRLLSGYKSQRRFAEKTGISPATISRIESEIQKPEVETLKAMAEYLDTTTLVELMVVCGYWGEEELLEGSNQNVKTPAAALKEDSGSYSKSNEEEFINSIDLSDEEVLGQFDLKIDGRSLTESEAKGIIAYIRSLRSMS